VTLLTCFTISFSLKDTFAPKHLVRVRAGDDMCGVRNWLDRMVGYVCWTCDHGKE
jgi:hypothetical protein